MSKSSENRLGTEYKMYNVNDVMEMLSIGSAKAYKVIAQLNAELKAEGYLTVNGRVPVIKFRERLYLKGRRAN